MKLNETEREIFENGLVAAEKRLSIALEAKEGTAVHESAKNIEAQIEYLQSALTDEKEANR